MTLRPSESGLSSLEIVIMAAIMSVLMIMITESMSTLTSVRSEQRQHAQLDDLSDRVSRRIAQDVRLASHVFTDTSVDTEYLLAMDLGFPPTSNGRRLPKVTARGYFEADKSGIVETGNVLFVAFRGPRVEVKYNGITDYHLQSLRFAVTTPIDVDGQLDLMRWSSDLLVDYWDVIAITDLTARSDVLQQLYESGVRYAWDSTAPRATGLFELSPSGGMTPLPVDRLVTGKEDEGLSRPLATRHAQLAANGVEGQHKVPAFAIGNGMFPAGFEIKVDGGDGGRLLLLRLVVQSARERFESITTETLRYFSTSG